MTWIKDPIWPFGWLYIRNNMVNVDVCVLRTSGEVKGVGMTGRQINKPARARRPKWPWLLAVVGSGAGLGWYLNQPAGSTLDYETVLVSRGDLTQVVTASG